MLFIRQAERSDRSSLSSIGVTLEFLTISSQIKFSHAIAISFLLQAGSRHF